MQHSTIAAIATAPGAGGIAIVRLSGPESYEVAERVFRPANPSKKVAEAKGYMERYFETYSTLRQYMTDIVAQAEKDGYVETLFHRRRALPELKSSNFNLREFGKRVALNMPVQGTAADIMKLAMLRVHDRLHREGLRARLLMQVHDELIVECPEAEREQVARILTEEMEHAATLSVPLTVDAHWGKNWLEAKG